jgi:ABC-type branched-subunit amino acid transport system ATPase component
MVPELSVAENIVLGLDHRSRSGVDAELKNRKAYGSALNQTLDLFELGDVRDVEINVLSSGVQRIVEVARCVASGSDVVLLDEPGVGLTTRERSQLKAVIRRLADEGRSVLLVEHDTNIVFDTADSVMVLDKGELIAHGSSSSIRSDPKVREAYLGEG